MNLKELTSLNPWWLEPSLIHQDDKIKAYQSKKYKYAPPVAEQTLKSGNIYSLRGPRQLGKTTTVKLIIQKLLLEKQINKQAIFYWSCEDIGDYNDLVDLVKSYLEFRDEHGVSESYIFLDEISFVKEWQRGIKLLVDRGFLKHTMVLLTGSHMIDIQKATEQLPGRRGKAGQDFELRPLSFREFCTIVHPSLVKKLPTISIYDPKDWPKLKRVTVHNQELNRAFNQYLKTGGFPLVINETLNAEPMPWLKEIYYTWISGDMAKLGKSEKTMLQVLKSIIRRQPSVVSWDALSKDAEIKSHLTMASYVEHLEGLFVLGTSYFYDLSKKRVKYSKNKKIHFLDPFIYRVFCERTHEEEKSAVIAEDITAAHLYRAEEPHLYHTVQRKETDFVIENKEALIGIEVKFQKTINRDDWSSLRPFKTGFLLTKDHFEIQNKNRKNHLAIPLPLFLYYAR